MAEAPDPRDCGVATVRVAQTQKQVEDTPPAAPPSAWNKTRVSLLLVGLTVLSFSPLLSNSYEFVNLDDPPFVSENPHVQAGLTAAGMRWAFTTVHAKQWAPLTWLSYQLDTCLFGSQPAGYHRTNLLLHAATVLVLAWVLYRMTGAPGRSVAVAALFAIHPLRVESVAWIAERKDVLSGLFWMLTLAAYTWYAECPRVSRYLLVLFAFGMGLLAKPMAVTLPFALLLLDCWPLRRLSRPGADPSPSPNNPRGFAPARPGWLLAEKVPLLLLSVAASLMAVHAQQGLVMSLEDFPLGVRVGNALLSYVRYLGMLVWPANLALYYPHRGDSLPLAVEGGAAVLLAGITVAVLWAGRRRLYLVVGWLWYLGTLVPVIGLVQLSNQALADRYSYIPSVGILILVVWGGAELAERWRCQELASVVVGILVVGCGLLTWLQVHYWKDSRTLWTHTLDVTGDPNPVAHNNLGGAYLAAGQTSRAEEHFTEAIRETPNYADAHYNLGLVRLRHRKPGEAIQCFANALSNDSNHLPALRAMGALLLQAGKREEAQACFEREAFLSGDRRSLPHSSP